MNLLQYGSNHWACQLPCSDLLACRHLCSQSFMWWNMMGNFGHGNGSWSINWPMFGLEGLHGQQEKTYKNLPASNLHRMSSVAPRVHPWKMRLIIIEIKLSPYLRVNRGWKGKILWLITCRASHTRTGRSRSLFFRLSRLSMAGFPWLRFRWALRGREDKVATIFKFVPKQCVHAVGFLR